jgi:hypothetical protein
VVAAYAVEAEVVAQKVAADPEAAVEPEPDYLDLVLLLVAAMAAEYHVPDLCLVSGLGQPNDQVLVLVL